MGPFEAIVIIAVVGMITSVIKSKHKAQAGAKHYPSTDEDKYEYDDQETRELQLEITAMKKRIEALEAIVTDKNYDLGREIDRL